MDVAIFGAGPKGQEAMSCLLEKGYTVTCFLDNDKKKQGQEVCGIPVIGLEKFIEAKRKERIVLGSVYKFQVEMERQLKEHGITNYEYFDRNQVYEKERLISYSSKTGQEDVILYHLLRDEKEIFYIDVGSNDPVSGSVTKLLYDMCNAHGINIEPQPPLCRITESERPRDITLCTAVGDVPSRMKLFLQEGGSTMHEENVILPGCPSIDVDVRTLKDICEEYLGDDGQEVSFLKVDVEGHEKAVLLGADFKNYRPKLIVMESTKPRTMVPSYEEWEYILTEAGYSMFFEHEINRYYCREDLKEQMSKKICSFDDLVKKYRIYHVTLGN